MSVKFDFDVLPERRLFKKASVVHPDRGFRLTQAQTEIALKKTLCVTFLKIPPRVDPRISGRTKTRGRIYGYRFRQRSHLWKTN